MKFLNEMKLRNEAWSDAIKFLLGTQLFAQKLGALVTHDNLRSN